MLVCFVTLSHCRTYKNGLHIFFIASSSQNKLAQIIVTGCQSSEMPAVYACHSARNPGLFSINTLYLLFANLAIRPTTFVNFAVSVHILQG